MGAREVTARHDHRALALIIGAVVCVIAVVAGILVVQGSQGSGAAPLPPGQPVITAAPTTPSSSAQADTTTPSTTTSTPTTSTSADSSTPAGMPTKAPRSTTNAKSSTAPSTHSVSPTPGPAPTKAPPRREQQVAPNTLGANTISIPVQDVTAPIVGACRVHDGAMDPPTDVHQTCTWKGGNVTVITGHVNYRGQGAGSFSGLAYLRAGDRVVTTDAAGHRTDWAVQTVQAYSKAALPQGVFLDAVNGGPTLRLVTCGGELNRSTGHYNDSVVVTLTPTH